MHIFKLMFNRKYRFFAEKIRSVQKSMWDLDFKITKARQMREASRQARDRAVESLQRVQTTPTSNDTGIIEKMEKQITDLHAQVKGYEAQMQMVDDQVNGKQATETEEGITGLIEHLGGLAELKELYRDYLKRI